MALRRSTPRTGDYSLTGVRLPYKADEHPRKQQHRVDAEGGEENPTLAYLLTHLGEPDFPVPLGVFRAVERPTYDGLLQEQRQQAASKPGAGDLQALLSSGDTWTVE